jgi:hypothetical protein
VDPATLTGTNIDCTLVKEPTCGDHIPVITTQLGQVPNEAGVKAVTVTCTITEIHPFKDLNLLGHDNITITGTSFPHELETSTVEIAFDDEKKTACLP